MNQRHWKSRYERLKADGKRWVLRCFREVFKVCDERSAVYAVIMCTSISQSVRPSIRPYITNQSSTKTANPIGSRKQISAKF